MLDHDQVYVDAKTQYFINQVGFFKCSLSFKSTQNIFLKTNLIPSFTSQISFRYIFVLVRTKITTGKNKNYIYCEFLGISIVTEKGLFSGAV